MENIVKKAIKGGYVKERYYFDENGNWNDAPYEVVVCNPLFWQALGKACGWSSYACSWDSENPICRKWCSTGHRETWVWNAMRFHEINLTQGWNKAVIWLEALITNQDK